MAIKGSSEVIKSPAEQDAIRRAVKASRKPNKRGLGRPSTESLFDGINADRLKERGRAMFGMLENKMCSSSVGLNDQLTVALISYIEHFIDASQRRGQSVVQRHRQAMKVACGGLHPAVRGYAERQLNKAFWDTNPNRRTS